MKRCRCAVVLAIAVLIGPSARAQIPVTDAGAITQLVNQVRQGVQEVQYLQQQVQQVMAVYNAIAHATDLGTAVGALGMLGIQNPLPVNPYAVQSLLSGRGSIAGMSGTIGGLFNTNFAANHIYTPTGDSYEATLLQRRATSIAGIEGLSGQLYQSMAQRLPLLAELQDRLTTATDPKDVQDLTARLAAEQSYIQSQHAQAQTLAIMQIAALQDLQQEREEQRHKDIDAVLDADPDK
jgi:type IV secretion system protein VirB5